MNRYEFLIDTYRTESLKTLSVWSQVPDARMQFRPEPRARTPLEHMAHQCLSEEAWMASMLGIAVPPAATPAGWGALPAEETRLGFLRQYGACAEARLAVLAMKPDSWFEESTQFFGSPRSRAWVLVRRFTHSAHHRAQLTIYLRLWGEALYSTYGPTADTGGLAKNGARVIYPYDSLLDLLEGEAAGGRARLLPGPGDAPPTERPSAATGPKGRR